MKLMIMHLTVAGSLFLCGCHKKDKISSEPQIINTALADGFPENIKKVNGYLFAGITTTNYSGFLSYGEMYYAAFGDPARNLFATFNHYSGSLRSSFTDAGNVDMQYVSVNGWSLPVNSQFNSIAYQQNSSGSSIVPGNHTNWGTGENGTFKAIDISIPKGYPVINTAALTIPSTISKADYLTLTIGNDISNYDSLVVTIDDKVNFSTIGVRKNVSKGASTVIFSPQDLIALNVVNYGEVHFYAYNYSTITINNKIHVFELSRQYIVANVSIQN